MVVYHLRYSTIFRLRELLLLILSLRRRSLFILLDTRRERKLSEVYIHTIMKSIFFLPEKTTNEMNALRRKYDRQKIRKKETMIHHRVYR